MRKILLIALVCLFVGCVAGYEELKNGLADLKNNNESPKAQVPADDKERTELEGATMRYVSSTNSTLTVELKNDTDSVWQSGNMRDYTLECERGGVWYTVEPKGDFANTMELMLFGPGEKLTHTFDFSERYGALSSGRYRVVKSWWANATETRDAGEFYLICEFTVE